MDTNRMLSVAARFALISCTCVSAQFIALTEDSPVIAECGEAAIFQCRTSVPYELTEVRWIRIKDSNYSTINLFRYGQDQQRCDLPQYVGRTELVIEGLTSGRLALKLFNVSVADEGTYHCYLETDTYYDFANAELGVTALGSDPTIDLEELQDGGIKAVCRSAGWYPEPTLENRDEEGEMKIQHEENGLYSIEYSRVITENSNRTFSCRFQTSFHRTYRESSVYVADIMFQKDTGAVTFFIVASAAADIAAVATAAVAAVAVWCLRTRRRNRQGASSAVRTQPSYLELDQALCKKSEQTQLCAEKNTTKGSPLLQAQDTLEQLQVCVVKNTERSPPVLQGRETLEQPNTCVVKNTERSPSVLQGRDTLEKPQVFAKGNIEGSSSTHF